MCSFINKSILLSVVWAVSLAGEHDLFPPMSKNWTPSSPAPRPCTSRVRGPAPGWGSQMAFWLRIQAGLESEVHHHLPR